MSKGDDYTLKHWASQMWTGMYAHACTLRVAEYLSVCVLGTLIPFLRRISSPHQLSSPILGIGVAHFRVITLDLLNHCFFWSLSSNDAKTRTKEEEEKKRLTLPSRGQKLLRGSLSPVGVDYVFLSTFLSPVRLSAACRQECVSLVCDSSAESDKKSVKLFQVE